MSIQTISSAVIAQLANETLNIETKIDEITIEHFEYTETNELKNIVLNITVETADEFEIIQIKINAENKQFNYEFEIENFVDELVRNL